MGYFTYLPCHSDLFTESADISVLSRSLDSAEIYISCSVHKYEWHSIWSQPIHYMYSFGPWNNCISFFGGGAKKSVHRFQGNERWVAPSLNGNVRNSAHFFQLTWSLTRVVITHTLHSTAISHRYSSRVLRWEQRTDKKEYLRISIFFLFFFYCILRKSAF